MGFLHNGCKHTLPTSVLTINTVDIRVYQTTFNKWFLLGYIFYPNVRSVLLIQIGPDSGLSYTCSINSQKHSSLFQSRWHHNRYESWKQLNDIHMLSCGRCPKHNCNFIVSTTICAVDFYINCAQYYCRSVIYSLHK